MVLKPLTVKKIANKGYDLYSMDENDSIHTTGVNVDDGNYDNGSFLDRDYDLRDKKNISINLENIGANAIKYKILSTNKHFDDFAADIADDDFDKEEKAETSLSPRSKATGSVELTGGPAVAASGTLTLASAVAITPAEATVQFASAVANTFATGTVTCAAVEAGDTVTINGNEYTAVAGAKQDNTEFSIDTGNNECATDLADSINNDTRPGTVGDVSAVANSAVVTVTTDVLGAAGNAVTLVSSNGTRLAVSGAGTLTGGVTADTITANGLVYTAVAGAKADNTQFSIDTSNDAAATDFADSVNNDARSGTLNDLTAVANTDTVTLTQTVPGTSGNATTLASSSEATRLVISGSTFSGGLEADTATVNGLVYTAVAGAKANNTQFSIDTSDTAAAADLVDSINNDARTPITEPEISYVATSNLGVVTITADINAGADGNGIDIAGTSNITASAANLENGVSASVNSIKVDGQEILSGAVPFRDTLNATATDVAANITAFASNPEYTAVAVGALITITAAVNEPSTATVVSTTTTITKTDSNMTGGGDGKAVTLEIAKTTPSITAIRLMAKESTPGSPGKIRADIKAQ